MNHIRKIQSEFFKEAASWSDLSYEAQVEYLRHHPKSKRRLTKTFGQIGVGLANLYVPEIQSFDKRSVGVISDQITQSVKKIADEYGITVRYGGGRYSNTQFTLKIELNIPASAEEQLDITKSMTNDRVHLGLAPTGTKVVLYDGRKAVITGRRRKKYDIEMDGKRYTINFGSVSVDPDVNPSASQKQRLVVTQRPNQNFTESQ